MGTEADIVDRFPAIQTPQPHVNGIGVVVGSLFVSVSAADTSTDLVKFNPVTSNSLRIPPSVLLPRIAGEPLRLDSVFPPHPRGLGDVWPLESELSVGEQGARFPLAYALQEFSADQEQKPWTWTTPEGELNQLKASEAVAGAFAAATADLSLCRGPYTLVIPNHLRMLRQQELVDACRSFGRDVKLLWRPVAGALVWCSQFGKELLRNDSPGEFSPGSLLCIHHGIDGFELATIDLIVRQIDGKQHLLPARRRPPAVLKPFLSEGMELLHRLADVDSTEGQLTPVEKWRKLWAGPWALQTIEELNGGICGATAAELIRGSFLANQQLKSDDLWRDSVWAGERLSTARFEQEWIDRLATVKEEISKHRVLGAVITGELASLPVSHDRTRAQRILRDLQLSLRPERILIGDEAASQHSLLADGAALYSAMLAVGQPTYLDTLPRVQLAAYITGTPGWIPLLNEADAYVDGGKTWHRPTPVSGLRALSGSDHVEVTLSHEEFATARKLSTKFPKQLTSDVPIRLSVSVEPAQGNARVEIVPDQPALFGSRRLFLEWRKMEVLPEEPNKWLSLNLPTLFPPLLKRGSSESLWRQVSGYLEKYCVGHSVGLLSGIRESLVSKSDASFVPGPNEESKPTAVGSDGIPTVGDMFVLETFVSAATDELRQRKTRPPADLVKAIGYTSTANSSFMNYLEWCLMHHGSALEAEELAACGWSLRDPRVIALFAEKLEIAFYIDQSGRNNWMKAFGEMIRYREDATREIPSARCESLTRTILRVFETQLNQLNFHQVFRNSALCLTFLLRRRAFDDDYLRPGSPVYQQVRSIFTRALRVLPDHRIGGTINPRKVVQLMLDYLDRKGPSVLAGGIELRDLVE